MSEAVDTMELSESFHELYKLEEMLRGAMRKEYPIPDDITLLLVGTAIKRLEHYQRKYKFVVGRDEDFGVDDLPDFLDLERLGKER